MSIFIKYISDESGATAIEYGLLAALIGIAIIAGAASVRDEIITLFSGTDGEFTKAFTKTTPPSP